MMKEKTDKKILGEISPSLYRAGIVITIFSIAAIWFAVKVLFW
jgi:hypothetical protein